jgi:hypothetical protein
MRPTTTPPRKVKATIDGLASTTGKGRLGFQSDTVETLALDFEGIVDNRHRGWLRKADARVPYLPRGTPIRNERHVSLVSREDLADVAAALDIPSIDPRWIGANIVVSGLQNVSFLPRGTHLFFEGGAILIVTDQNAPCTLAGEAIASHVPGRADIKQLFPKHAQGRRGVVCSVEHPGVVTAGTTLEARIPAQWIF